MAKEEIEERQVKLYESLHERYGAIVEEMYTIVEIIDNEEEGYKLIPDLKYFRKTIKKMINASIA